MYPINHKCSNRKPYSKSRFESDQHCRTTQIITLGFSCSSDTLNMSSENNREGGDRPSRKNPPFTWLPKLNLSNSSKKQSSQSTAPEPQTRQYPKTPTTTGGPSVSRTAQPQWRRGTSELSTAQAAHTSRESPIDEPPTPWTTHYGSQPEWRRSMGMPSTSHTPEPPRSTTASRPSTAYGAEPTELISTSQPSTPQATQPEWRRTMGGPPVRQVIQSLQAINIDEASTPKTAQPEWRRTMGEPSTPSVTRPSTAHEVVPKTPASFDGPSTPRQDNFDWRRTMRPPVTPPKTTEPPADQPSPASSSVTVTSLSSTKTVINKRWEATPSSIMKKSNWRKESQSEEPQEPQEAPISPIVSVNYSSPYRSRYSIVFFSCHLLFLTELGRVDDTGSDAGHIASPKSV